MRSLVVRQNLLVVPARRELRALPACVPALFNVGSVKFTNSVCEIGIHRWGDGIERGENINRWNEWKANKQEGNHEMNERVMEIGR